MARPRNYRAEYEARQRRAQAGGFGGYGAQRRFRKYGETARSSDFGDMDLDTTSVRRRVHEAVATFDDDVDDWEQHLFASSRVNAARYSPSRRQLVVDWTNSPGGAPPYPTYIYDAVPPAVWTGFQTAGSAGRFVNSTLNTFPYRPTSQTV